MKVHQFCASVESAGRRKFFGDQVTMPGTRRGPLSREKEEAQQQERSFDLLPCVAAALDPARFAFLQCVSLLACLHVHHPLSCILYSLASVAFSHSHFHFLSFDVVTISQSFRCIAGLCALAGCVQ